MNGTRKSILLSLAVFLSGLAITSILMFAFVADAEARSQGPHTVGSKLEIAISDAGRVIVRGAQVTQVSGSTITARTEWGPTALTWTIITDTETDFVTKGGSGSDLDSLSVGHYVSFSGQLDDSSASFMVDADAVRNWSLEGEASARAEAKTDTKSRWSEWKHFPFFTWFKENR